jgi:hypothetical protein
MTPEMIEKLWARCGGKCECLKAAHNHPGGKCSKVLVREMLDKSGEGGWKICKMFVAGGENINAYLVYCDECFQQLPSILKKEDRFGA